MHLREHRINSSLKPNSEQCRIPVGQIGRMGRPYQLFSDAAQSDEEDLESEGDGEGEDEECAALEVRVPLTSPGNGNGLSVPTVSVPQKRQRNNGDSEDDLDDALFFLADVLAAGPSPGSVMPRTPSDNQLLHKEPHHQEPQPQQQQPQQQPQKQEGEEDLDGDDMKFLEFLDHNCHLLSDDVLASLTSCCSNLRYINLSRNLQITDASIAAIVSQCPNIIDINIFGCKALTDKSIHAISSHCSALRTVNLRKCENITDNSIVSLAENCQHLQNITLNDCKNISNVVRKVAEYRRNLLSMSIFNFFNKLSDDSVMKVAYCCPMLEAFKIGNCIDNSNISDASVMKLAANCPLLRVLHIERSGITDEALLKIATCCTQLRSLNVSDCALTTVAAVQQLLEMCPSIEHIACEFFEYKTSDRSLRVCGSRMTDGELHRIIRCIPEILHVNLSSGENFQDISVVRIADKFGGQLQSLSVAACEQLTDSCVSYLLDKCPNLVKLDLGYNRFSGVPFVDISEKQVRLSLKQIDISSCCMSTEVVIQILRVCPRLSVLFLNDKSIPFEQIRRIYCSRQLSPQQQQQLLDMQT
eukprot:gene20071-20608_t